MVFSRPVVEVPTVVFEHNERTYRSAPVRMAREFPKAIAPVRKTFQTTMAKEPSPVPTYQRTHQLSRGWRTELRVSADGGVLTGLNGVPYRRYVQGAQARIFHIRRGWAQEKNVVPTIRRQAEVVARGTWARVSIPSLKGVRR